jgi:hypothetical protein
VRITVWPRLLEDDQIEIGEQVAEDEATPSRQVAEVNAPLRAEDHEAQVDAERRSPHHPHRRTAREQRQRGELRAAGVDREAHQDREADTEAALRHRDAGDEPPCGEAGAERQHVARAVTKVAVARQITQVH